MALVSDPNTTEADNARRPSAASIGADPSQHGYIPQPPPHNPVNWYPPSDARVQHNNMPYAHGPAGAAPPTLVTRSTNGGGADGLGQGMTTAHAQLRRDLGENPPLQGAHGQGAVFHGMCAVLQRCMHSLIMP